MLGIICLCSGLCRASFYVGPHFCVLRLTLGLFFVCKDPSWASLCAGADARPHLRVLGPMQGFIFVCWGFCWASFPCAGAYAGLCWASFLCAGAMMGLISVCSDKQNEADQKLSIASPL